MREKQLQQVNHTKCLDKHRDELVWPYQLNHLKIVTNYHFCNEMLVIAHKKIELFPWIFGAAKVTTLF